MAEELILTAGWVQQIQTRIARLGLSQAEVEGRAGLSEGHLGKILRRKRKSPTLETALSIEAVLVAAEIEKVRG